MCFLFSPRIILIVRSHAIGHFKKQSFLSIYICQIKLIFFQLQCLTNLLKNDQERRVYLDTIAFTNRNLGNFKECYHINQSSNKKKELDYHRLRKSIYLNSKLVIKLKMFLYQLIRKLSGSTYIFYGLI